MSFLIFSWPRLTLSFRWFLKLGANSGLHIIIFDEIDAICKQRGSMAGSTGVHDTVVNQLLSKIDGVEQLNNILVIGKNFLSESILRNINVLRIHLNNLVLEMLHYAVGGVTIFTCSHFCRLHRNHNGIIFIHLKHALCNPFSKVCFVKKSF